MYISESSFFETVDVKTWQLKRGRGPDPKLSRHTLNAMSDSAYTV